MHKYKKLFEGDYVIAWKDKDGWLYLDFTCNMTTLIIPDVFVEEVVKDLEKVVKSISPQVKEGKK